MYIYLSKLTLHSLKELTFAQIAKESASSVKTTFWL